MENNNSVFRVSVVVVVYQVAFSDSATLNSLINIDTKNVQLNVVIWDNSSEVHVQEIDTKGIFNSLTTRNCPENKSLSEVYNLCAKDSLDCDIFCILDQDSVIPKSYFKTLRRAYIANQDIDLFVPLVRSSNIGTIVSPGNLKFVRGYYWKQHRKGRIAAKKKLVVGSGMCIRTSMISSGEIQFDERLSLYGVDSKFMIDFARIRENLYVLDECILHGHSESEQDIYSVKAKRFKNWVDAWRLIYSDEPLKRISFNAYAVVKAIKFSVQSKKIIFIRNVL